MELNYPTYHLISHPLLAHKVSQLRSINTTSGTFRRLVKEIAILECYEASKDLLTVQKEVTTPIETNSFPFLEEEKLVFVNILRAGLGMSEGAEELFPEARFGHIGMRRNETTHQPEPYYCNLPKDLGSKTVFLLDPMLATGGSSSAAISMLKEHGCKRIKLMSIIAAPEGVKKMAEDHPDVDIYIATLDRELNENCYILPGLGDAGDRIFGTK